MILSFNRRRFPAKVIGYAVWVYFRFNLSIRDVDELLPKRGIEVSWEPIRQWVISSAWPLQPTRAGGDGRRRAAGI